MSREQRPSVPVLRFLGAAGTVTGSRFLIDTPHARVLVECGLFQGLKPLRLRNWEPFPVDPETIDTVVLTHAHLDHTGYLPALVRGGFRGHIFATEGTFDPFNPGSLIEIRSVEQSRALNDLGTPAIIISASGMATG